MSDIRTFDVLIVGSGPASMSTALHLVKAHPTGAQRVVAIDKAIHPREKVCGGGVTKLGEDVLHNLGLQFEPAHVPVRELRFVYQNSMYAIRDNPCSEWYGAMSLTTGWCNAPSSAALPSGRVRP